MCPEPLVTFVLHQRRIDETEEKVFLHEHLACSPAGNQVVARLTPHVTPLRLRRRAAPPTEVRARGAWSPNPFPRVMALPGCSDAALIPC